MDKKFISAQSLLEDSFKLAHKVYQDGFRPQFIIGVWRGGAPIGIAVQEYFQFKDIKTDHISVRTSSYLGINQQQKEISVHGLQYIIDKANNSDAILIVDDVFDSGKSINALLNELKKDMRMNLPSDIRIACPWYKPKNKQVDIIPDYYIYESDDWLIFPHEIAGLSSDEIKQHKHDLLNIQHLFL